MCCGKLRLTGIAGSGSMVEGSEDAVFSNWFKKVQL